MKRNTTRQQPPLKRLAERQKRGAINALVAQTEAQIRGVFADAAASVQGILAQFAAAYAAEQQRIAAEHTDEEDGVPTADEVRQTRVPQSWLTTSGWGPRVTHALLLAHTSAMHASGRYVQHGMRVAHQLGTSDARELLTLAMRPAVKAGMTHWRPK